MRSGTAPPPFRDRRDAGAALAAALQERGLADVVVLGLPRGGVPVAAVVADALRAPLDVVVVRKLGVPWQPELAMGAVGEGGVVVRHEEVLRRAGVDPAAFDEVLTGEQAEVERRVELLRPGRPRATVAGRTAVVVDDGLATGSTARAACAVLRAAGARRVVLAVPVAPAGSRVEQADELVVVRAPEPFGAVGRWYADFAATSEQEVVDLLRR
jgi:putative phosphoribosyl transferase